jgi:hypothetical protein
MLREWPPRRIQLSNANMAAKWVPIRFWSQFPIRAFVGTKSDGRPDGQSGKTGVWSIWIIPLEGYIRCGAVMES